jgi:hypothetical protein
VVRQNRISAVICSTDIARSQDSYEHRVGLRRSSETIENHLVFEGGEGTTLLVHGARTPTKPTIPRCGSGRPMWQPMSRS